ncbi:MAG: DUF2752 domain-containing protein [Bacteroidales bacterium]
MKNKLPHPYHTLNLALVLVMLTGFLYVALFIPGEARVFIPCVHSQVTGEPCPSCGLTRAFSFMVQGEFNAAREANPAAIPVFLFFILQLLLRSGTSLFLYTKRIKARPLAVADACLSGLLFLCAILPFYSDGTIYSWPF